MLHHDLRALVEGWAALPGPPSHLVPVDLARAAHVDETARLSGPGEPVLEVRELAAPGPAGPVRIRLYRPAPGPLPVLAYVHGGGWVIGTLDTYDALCRALANATGALVASIDYRLAPEHRFPAAPDDVLAAVRWLAAEADALGAVPGRMAIAGDSAGGNLAAVTARRMRDLGDSPLRLQVLVYPVCDSAVNTPSYRRFTDGYGLSARDMQRYWNLYLDGADGRAPDASPLRADLAGLPPALVLVAGYDVLRDEGVAYARALADAGVDVRVREYEGAVHGFFRWLAVTELARQAIDEVGAAVRAALA